MTTELNKLMEWYDAHCDGDWEHMYGIHISTLDNPGWSVKIDIAETEMETKLFEEKNFSKSEVEWYRCWVKDNVFHGAGGPQMLTIILNIFLEWTLS